MKKVDKKKILFVGMSAIGVCWLGYTLRKYSIEINDIRDDLAILHYHSNLDRITINQLRAKLDKSPME